MKRSEINYSKKLDAAVEKFGDDECWEYLDQHPGYAGMTNGAVIQWSASAFDDHCTNDAVELGFEMAMRCPADKSVFSGCPANGGDDEDDEDENFDGGTLGMRHYV